MATTIESLIADRNRVFKLDSNPWQHYLTGRTQTAQAFVGFRHSTFVFIEFTSQGDFVRYEKREFLPNEVLPFGQALPSSPSSLVSVGSLQYMFQLMNANKFREEPIHVKPFHIKEINVGLSEFSAHWEKILSRSSASHLKIPDDELEEIAFWKQKGRFVLSWDGEQLLWPAIPVKTKKELAATSDRIFRLRSEPAKRYATGLSRTSQLLVGVVNGKAVLIQFDMDGNLLGWEQLHQPSPQREDEESLRLADVIEFVRKQDGFEEKPIHIHPFVISKLGVGVKPYPSDYNDFLQDVDAADESDEEETLQELSFWAYSGQFVFHWGDEFQMNHNGAISST